MRALFKNLVVAVITLEARAALRKYKPKIIAVTGSVGKTSTKDAIFAALQKSEHARKSQKSFNSEIGVPLTILGAQNAWSNPLRWFLTMIDGLFLIVFSTTYPEWLVLEVGADRPGDIQSLATWLRAEVVVITRLPDVPVHVEFFDSPEAVIEEKASLIKALVPGGTLVLFGDDRLTRSLERRLPETDAKLLTFGFSEECDVRGLEVAALYDAPDAWPVGMTATITAGDAQARLNIRGVLGAHAFLPALAAAGVATALGKNVGDTVGALAGYEPPPGRMRLIAGIKDTLIIDDTYNASPAATEAALEALALARRPGGRTIAALGDMLELGRRSVDEHRKLGRLCASTCDVLITVGFRARDIAQGALDGGMKESAVLQFEDSQLAAEALQNILKAGDVVLIKGSQGIRMERAVKEVMQEPERAAELLVRQDEEWKKR
jgi:UDP-N-acetylmuramoyl-tripeptide--D-alanyl-D-alanine ligase